MLTQDCCTAQPCRLELQLIEAASFPLCRNGEGTWDTPDAARLLMRTVAAQHAEALGDLPWAPPGAGTLLEGFRESANTVAALMKGAQDYSTVVHSRKACPSAADGSSVRRCAARIA